MKIVSTYTEITLMLLFCSITISCQNNNNGWQGSDIEKNHEDTVWSKRIGYQFDENFANDSLRHSKIHKAILEGDTLSFSSVMDDYFLSGFDNEFLFYAMLMADRYEYSEAYFGIYTILADTSQGNTLMQNGLYKKMADYNLIKAYSKGSRSAYLSMLEVFGENFDSLRVMRYLDKLEQHLMKEKIEY